MLNEKKDKKKIKKILKFVDLIIIANGPSFEDSKKNFFNYIKYLDSELDIIKKIKKRENKNNLIFQLFIFMKILEILWLKHRIYHYQKIIIH